MITISDLLSMDNDQLYDVYLQALKDRDLRVINSVRSIIADKYSLKALEHSPVDSWRNCKDIARFFTVKM